MMGWVQLHRGAVAGRERGREGREGVARVPREPGCRGLCCVLPPHQLRPDDGNDPRTMNERKKEERKKERRKKERKKMMMMERKSRRR